MFASHNIFVSTFVNPESSGWQYDGTYTFVLADDVMRHDLEMPDFVVNGSLVTVKNGKITTDKRGISLFDSKGYERFYNWDNRLITIIRKESGEILWVNETYRYRLTLPERNDWSILEGDAEALRLRLLQRPVDGPKSHHFVSQDMRE